MSSSVLNLLFRLVRQMEMTFSAMSAIDRRALNVFAVVLAISVFIYSHGQRMDMDVLLLRAKF